VLDRTTAGATILDSNYYYQRGAMKDDVGNPLRRTELVDGTTYNTTYQYDKLYRMLSESRTPGNYRLSYTYDQVGNRLTRNKDGTTVTYTYDSNDKLTAASGGGQSASMSYDSNGNMTGVSGTMFGTWTLSYDDENRLTSVSYPGGTDQHMYDGAGRVWKAVFNGPHKYVYNGDRVLDETDNAGALLARYTTASGSYYEPLLHFKRADGSVRYPIYDGVGTARRLVDGAGAVTDTYTLDAFGRQISSSGTTPNPYRFGAAWGYLTETPGSGLLRLGARFHWPEVGRFIQQDPKGGTPHEFEGFRQRVPSQAALLQQRAAGPVLHSPELVQPLRWNGNPYAYAANNPLTRTDPDGQS
jgi:uncharacterized protein RhaS with RHS repeats